MASIVDAVAGIATSTASASSGQRRNKPADTTTTQATTADAHMMTIVTTPARPGLLARWRTPAG